MSIRDLPFILQSLLATVSPLVLTVVLASLVIANQARVEETNRWVQHTGSVIADARHIERLIVDLETGQRGFLLTGLDEFLEPYYSSRSELSRRLTKLSFEISDNPSQVERLKEIDRAIDRWHREVGEPEIAIRRQSTSAETLLSQIDMYAGKAQVDRIRDLVAAFVQVEETLLLLRQQALADATASNERTVIIGASLTVIIALTLAFLISRKLTAALTRLLAGVSRVADGKPERLPDDPARDEIATLTRGFNEMVDELVEEQRRRESRALAFDSIQRSPGVDDLSRALLELLLDQLRAPTGAVYVANSEGGLDLKATKGVSPDHSPPVRIEPEVGRLGEGMNADTSTVIEGLPVDYLSVETASGKCSLTTVLLQPARDADGVAILVEIGLHQPPSSDQHVFVEQTTSLFVHAMRRAQDRERVEQLLAESQRKSEELHDRGVELERMSEYKSQFLANMSHEIRTPMSGVMGLLSLLQRSDVDPEQLDLVERAKDSASALLRIINDILDFSKIEAGRLELDPAPFDPAALIEDVVRLFGLTGENTLVEINAEHETPLPAQLLGDDVRIRQILMNLVGNAVKFTKRGEVRVAAGYRSAVHGDGEKLLRLTVTDTGIGIDPDQLARLNEPFIQADVSTNRQHGGTGLGLSISLQLAELMGGRLEASSVVGVGSTFAVEIPLPEVNEDRGTQLPVDAPGKSEVREAPVPDLLTGTVLIAEDNATNQLVAQRFLDLIGCEFDIANNGQEALERLREGVFDVVLMDCSMPVMDGYEATRRIRAGEGGRRDVPIVALTANALHRDEQLTDEAGMDAYLTKPIEIDLLRRTLARWLPEKMPVDA